MTQTIHAAAFAPTGDCDLGCEIAASSVQIIYWAVTLPGELSQLEAAERATMTGVLTANKGGLAQSGSSSVSLGTAPLPPETTPATFSTRALKKRQATNDGPNSVVSEPQAANNAPYTVVSDGFTFTSPSVYVAYRGLKASAMYAPFGLPLGSGVHDVTVGYAPEALSTSHCNQAMYYMTGQSYAPINYTQLQYPPQNSEITDCPHNSGDPIVGAATYDPGGNNIATNAFFSVPGNLTWVDPAWSTCIPVTYGVFDPPRSLKGEAVVVAPTPLPAVVEPQAAVPAATANAGLPVVTALADPNQGSSDALKPAPLLVDPNDSEPIVEASAPAAVVPAVEAAPVVEPPPVVQNTQPAVNLGSNPEVLNAVTPNSNPDTEAADPNEESDVQMSALHEALDVEPTPPAAQPEEAAVQPPANQQQEVAVQPPANQQQEATVNPPANQQQEAEVNPPANQNPPANKNPPANQQQEAAVQPSNNPIVLSTSAPPVLGGNTVVPAANGGAVIGGSTYAPGSQATLSGQVYDVGSSVIKDQNSKTIPIAPSAAPLQIAGNTVAAAAQNAGVVIASSTYAPGQQGQISGQTFSVGPDNIAVAGSTHALPATPSENPVMVGSQSVSRASDGGVVIGSSTIAPGQIATVNNQVVSAGPSNVAIGSSTFALAPSGGAILQQAPANAQVPLRTPVLVGGQPVAKASDGGVVIGGSTSNGQIVGGTTVAPGHKAVVNGQTVSAGPSNVAINGESFAIPSNVGARVTQAPQQTIAPVLLGGQPIAAAPNGGVVVGGTTVKPGVVTGGTTVNPGSVATISGHVISAGPSNKGGPASVGIDGTSYAIPSKAGDVIATQALVTQAPVKVGGQDISRAANGGLVIAGSTLAPGSQTTIDGHTISAPLQGGSNVVVDGSTVSLATTSGAILSTQSAISAPVEIGGQTIARAPNGGFIIAGATLAPGAVATVDGHTISAGPASANNIVIDGSTIAAPTRPGAILETAIPEEKPFLIGGQSITRAANGALVIGTSTIPPGRAVTIAGHTISANPGDENVIIDGKNYELPTTSGAILETAAAPTPKSNLATTTNTIEDVVTLIDGQCISAGGPDATISGKIATVLPSDSGIVIGGTTYPIPPQSIFTVGTAPSTIVFTASSAGFVIPTSTTVSPAAPPVTAAGTLVSLGTSGVVAVGSKTVTLAPPGSILDGGFVSGVAYPSGSASASASASGSGAAGATATNPTVSGSNPPEGAAVLAVGMPSWVVILGAAAGWGVGLLAVWL